MMNNNDERNPDPERMDQHDDKEKIEDQKFNEGGNASDYDGGHPGDGSEDNEDRTKNGESYARRQHGKDEIEDRSFNEGGNASDYDGWHPEDSTGGSEVKKDSDK